MDYEIAKQDLIKKIGLIFGVAIIFTVLGLLGGLGSFGNCLLFGLVFGFIFYIPRRLKDVLHTKFFANIAITIIYYVILFFLIASQKPLYTVIAVLMGMFPIFDIGYSIYKLLKLKKEQ